ncbi:MAG: isoprenylcysteine carboxylmethyltransferase family protein [Verrucomicrobia bacterium]|nr:isoprenylcysteine carboxylmethyltransferase family protein [Verrucomicrobiota bacterium]
MSKPFLHRGGLWVIAQSVLMLAVVVLAVGFHGDWTRLSLIVPGAVLFLIGGVFGIGGVLALDTNRTPFPRPRDDSHLVRRGIYAWVRHPLYTSVMAASLGWALIWQSWPALAAAVLLVPFFAAKARREERWLREKFPDYADYERAVPRFVPGKKALRLKG